MVLPRHCQFHIPGNTSITARRHIFPSAVMFLTNCPSPEIFQFPHHSSDLLWFFFLSTVDQSLNTLHGLFHITQAGALSAEAAWPCRGRQEGRRFHTCHHCRGSVLSGFLAFSSWLHIRDNKMCVSIRQSGLCKHTVDLRLTKSHFSAIAWSFFTLHPNCRDAY